MIRINLLPVKTSRKQEAGRQQLILFVLAVVVALGGNGYAWQVRSSEEARLQAQVAKTKAQIAVLDKVIAEVKDINAKETELNTKLDALKTLKAGRAGPVKVLDALQTAVPPKVWLTKLDEKGGAMSLDGSALTQDDLAGFMSALQNIVDTPDGIGRLVAGDNGGESRVEITGGKIESFKVDKVTPFFTNVQLKADKEAGNLVSFSLTLSANYSA
jgi:type IV pilus assembly protein PilN